MSISNIEIGLLSFVIDILIYEIGKKKYAIGSTQ